MQEYGPDINTKGAKGWCVSMELEGTTAKWMVTLHNDDASKLRNFDHFMGVLQKYFEDPLAIRNARTRMKTISQGCWSVASYTQEF